MELIKTTCGVVAVLIAFAGYAPYVLGSLKGRTHPHVYSWFIWALVAAIAFALQVSDGADAGAYVTLATAIICALIFAIGLVRRGKRDITKLDTGLLVLTLAAIPLWLLAGQPLLSAMLVSLVDALGFVPTIRKSWHKPYAETALTYAGCSVRFIFAIAALSNYTAVTLVYPLTLIAVNGSFVLFLLYRRSRISNTQWP